jgi:hypothetical protein
MSSPSAFTPKPHDCELSSDPILTMDYDSDSSRRSGESGLPRRQTYTRFSTGPFDPDRARADMIYEQTGFNTDDQRFPKPPNQLPDPQHAGPRSDRGSQASSYNSHHSHRSDKTVRPARPRSPKPAHRRKPNRPRSPAQSASSEQSRITARRIPLQDDRQQNGPYAQESRPSERTLEGAPLFSPQLPIFNNTSGQGYDFPSANFATSSNAGSSRHGSRLVSSPQGPGKGFTPQELQRMQDLSISGNSDTRSYVSGGLYNPSLVPRYQQSDQRSPTRLSPYSIDTGRLDMREQMRDKLRPLVEAARPFVQPKDSIRAHGAVVIAREQFISDFDEVVNRGNSASAYHQHAVAGSSPRSSDRHSAFDRSPPAEEHGRLLQAPHHTDFSERSAGSGARAGYGDLPAGRNEYTQREPSSASQQSDGYPQQPRTENPLKCLQVERYGAVPHPPSSRSTHQHRSGFRNFVDPRSMHSAGTQSRRGPPMPPSRGGRYPDNIEEEWSKRGPRSCKSEQCRDGKF